jgi:aspartate/methionine/tyrosine aminotransferase
MDKQLAGQKSCSRLKVEGGWNAVIRVPATHSDEDIALELLSTTGVHVHPGHFYDFPAAGHLVVSLIVEEMIFGQGLAGTLSFFD